MATPTPDQLREFVNLQRAALHLGVADFETKSVGPLWQILLTSKGVARPGWSAAARSLLATAVAIHVSTVANEDRAREISQSLRTWWGIDLYPPRQRTVLASSMDRSDKQLRRWEAAVVENPLVLERLTFEVAGAPVDRATIRPWSEDPEDWPPHEMTVGLSRAMNEAAGLDIDLVEDSINVLRQATAMEMSKYLANEPGIFRRFAESMRKPWRRADRYWAVGDGPLPAAGRLGPSPVVSAVTQMILMSVAHEGSDVLFEVLGERVGVERMVEVLPVHEVDHTRLLLLKGRVSAESQNRISGAARKRLETSAFQPPNAAAADSFTGTLAFQVAAGMRRMKPSERRREGARYVRRRSTYAPPSRVRETEQISALARYSRALSSDSDAEGALLALADQAVQLMLLDLKERDLLLSLGAIIRASPSSYAYEALDLRNQGLLTMKLSRNYGRALTQILQARMSLDLHGADLLDDQSLAESAQQIALSAGGVCVRILEEALLVPSVDDADQGTAAYARAALLWSRSATDRLDAIEKRRGGPIAARRYDDMHISWANWRVKALLQLLRAQVISRAAIEAELITLEQLREIGIETSERNIEHTYRQLVTTPSVTADDVVGIRIQAAWISFLHGGSVPAVEDLAAAVRDMGPFDTAQERVAQGVTHVSPAPEEIAVWLQREKINPGVLAQISPRGFVARALDRTSGNRYSRFRATLGPLTDRETFAQRAW